MTATITVVQSRTVQSDSECVFHGYGTPLDISAEDVCFYVSFHYCVFLAREFAWARVRNGRVVPQVYKKI